MNCGLLTPASDEDAKGTECILAAPSLGLRINTHNYIKLLAHLPFYNSKWGNKWLR